MSVILRPLALADAPALHSAFSDPECMRYWSRPPHASLAETEADIAWWLETAPLDAFAILDEAGEVAGRTGLVPVREGVGEVGIMLRRDRQGRGLAGRALQALLAHGFEARGLHRIQADIDPDNHASLRLFERAGFQREGLLRQAWRTHLGLRDTVMLGFIASDWASPATSRP